MEHARFNLDAGPRESLSSDGKVCVTEAAIVAAGFEYREVADAYSTPECFSRPLVTYAIAPNDSALDTHRQELLAPFISRLAGSATSYEVEMERARFLVRETCRRIVTAFAAYILKRRDLAAPCKNASTVRAATVAIWDVLNAACVVWKDEAPEWNAEAPNFSRVDSDSAIDEEAVLAVQVAGRAIELCCDRVFSSERIKYCTRGAQILDEAIMLGAQRRPERHQAATRLLVPA
jgi:hypothetical protein